MSIQSPLGASHYTAASGCGQRPSRLMAGAIALCLVLLTACAGALPAAEPSGARALGPVELAQPVASYDIEAALSADGKLVRGRETVRYRNPSPDTLDELYLHLYLNGFRSADTTWMREAAAEHRGLVFDSDHTGSIDVESIAAGGQAADLQLEGDGTIARLPLPQPLTPGSVLDLTVTWTARLPRVFARTGWAPGGFTMVAQWYPKLAVYDARRGGWDREPWHANAEFFHDFGDYDLSVTAPARRIVVAAGEPSGREDHEDGTSTWHFSARSVSDVAWLAAEDYLVPAQPYGDKTIAVALPASEAGLAGRYFAIARDSLRHFEAWLGAYPWPRVTIVVPSAEAAAAGGMEYPTLVTSALPAVRSIPGIHDVEMITAHELAHEWFPMQLGTDEAREPWLDEALAEYFTQRLLSERYGSERALLDLPFARLSYDALLHAGLASAVRLPITLRAWDYAPGKYSAAVYAKGAALLATLQRVAGDHAFTDALAGYVERWRWRQLTGGDFRAALAAGLADAGAASADPWLDQLAFGERALAVQAAQVSEDRATILRTGDAALPVDGALQLASGETVAWHLAAQDERLELAAPAGQRILVVTADPESRLVVSTNQISEASTGAVQISALAGLAARLVELAALVLQLAGQFG